MVVNENLTLVMDSLDRKDIVIIKLILKTYLERIKKLNR